jgi:sulfur relay (sulfurtransferase) DsrC/TusE family protein
MCTCSCSQSSTWVIKLRAYYVQLQLQPVINAGIKLRAYYVHLQLQPVIKMGIKLRPYYVQLQVQPVINMGYNCVATVYGRSGTALQNYEALLTLSATNYLVKFFFTFFCDLSF